MKTLNSYPNISAVVPVYNVEQYLERCIDSLLGQTLPFHEIILINDGSTDASGDICDRYAKSCAIFRVVHQANQGLSAARNRGLDITSGEYVTFVDSDDWISPLFNESLYRAICETGADIAIGAMVRSNEKYRFPDAISCEPLYREFSANAYMKVFLRVHSNRCVHYACGKLYRSHVLESNHFPEGMSNEDVEGFFKSLLNSCNVVEIEGIGPLYCYFFNSESITGTQFGENYTNLPQVWKRIRKIAENRSPSLVNWVAYNQRRVWFTLLCDSIIRGNSDTDAQFSDEIEQWRCANRANFGYLLKSPMTARRKLLLIMVTLFYPMIRVAYRKSQVIRQKIHMK